MRLEAYKMEIAMDTNSGKALDEACNHNNDRYNDEVLYTTWVETPQAKAGAVGSSVSAYGASVQACVQNFMARLSACQESVIL